MTGTGVILLGLWLAYTLFAIALTAEVNSECRTTESLPGTCIPLAKCQRLFDMFWQPRPLPPATSKLLRAERCGSLDGKPLVCCRDETAPQQEVNITGRTGLPTEPMDVSTHRNVGLVNPEFCGQISSVTRIFNGEATGVFEMPWMALLKVQTHNGKRDVESFVCGGSLINQRYILTAAHCIPNKTSSRLVSVRLGEHDTSTVEDCVTVADTRVCAAPPQNIKVESFVRHPGYSANKLGDDIGLIRLAEPADLGRNSIVPICLPVGLAEQSKNLDSKTLTVAGWGLTERGSTSPRLLKANLPVMPTEKCQDVFHAYDLNITEGLICAGGTSSKQNSCSGDSGGPLKSYGRANEDDIGMVQYGVVSVGHKYCATEGTPGIYTRIGPYMSWILDNIEPF